MVNNLLLVLYLSTGTIAYEVPNGLTCDSLYEMLENKQTIRYVAEYNDEGDKVGLITTHNNNVLHATVCTVKDI